MREAMREISDELLMAYVDGELGAEEIRSVEEYLLRNPEEAGRLEVFAATREPLAEVFNRPVLEDIPDRVLDILKPSIRPAAKRGLWKELLALAGRGRLGWSPALAFSLLLLMSAGAGWVVGRFVPGHQPGSAAYIALDGGSLRATGPFAEALESAASSRISSWVAGGRERVSLKPVLSFRSTKMGFCRQYEMSLPAAGSFAGLACRGPRGVWHVRMHTKTADAVPQDGRTVPAAGGRTPALDAFVDKIIDGPALGAEEEAGLIRNRWQGQP